MDREAWGGYGPWGHSHSDTTEHVADLQQCVSFIFLDSKRMVANGERQVGFMGGGAG